MNIPQTERNFFEYDEIHPKKEIKILPVPKPLNKNEKPFPYSEMPKKEGFEHLQTADGEELVPNLSRPNHKSTKDLVRRFEKSRNGKK